MAHESLLRELRDMLKDEQTAQRSYEYIINELERLGLKTDVQEVEKIQLQEMEHHQKILGLYKRLSEVI